MPDSSITSAERLLATINRQPTDRVPVLMYQAASIPALEHNWHDRVSRAQYLLNLGIDEVLLVSPPWPMHPAVTVRSWYEQGDRYPTVYTCLETPAGPLRWAARVTDDFAVDAIPMYADHLWPRLIEPLVKREADLEALAYVAFDPRRTDLGRFRSEMVRLRREADRLGVLFQAWMHPAPLHAMTFLGGNAMPYLVRDNPALVRETLRVMQAWSLPHLEILLDAGVDAIYYSGCYETVDFFAPTDVRELFHPLVAESVRLTHQAGAKFQYFVETGAAPFLEDYARMGVDMLSALDAGGANPTDPVVAKRLIGDRVCLIGGIDPREAFERGTTEDVRCAVLAILRQMAPGGGYVLSTSGSFEAFAKAENILALAQYGLEYGRYPLTVS